MASADVLHASFIKNRSRNAIAQGARGDLNPENRTVGAAEFSFMPKQSAFTFNRIAPGAVVFRGLEKFKRMAICHAGGIWIPRHFSEGAVGLKNRSVRLHVEE